MKKVLESLSEIERKIVPFLSEDVDKIVEKSGLDKVSVLRALRFLENKGFVKLKTEKKKVVELGVNGHYYKKNHLPERNLLSAVSENNYKTIEEVKKISKLSDNEFKAALGVLKKKSLIEMSNGKVFFSVVKEEISKKFPEELLLDKLPIELEDLDDADKYAFGMLKGRKEIIEINEEKRVVFELTNDGKGIAGKKIKLDLIEEVTPEIIKNFSKNKKFRRYDVKTGVPRISGGKRHFVNQAIEQGRRIWLDMGFKEMTGGLVVSAFWNFDALFTPQDHPVREMQDTFYLKDLKAKLPKKSLVESVKKAHEKGVLGSKGWNYVWDEQEARKVLLRTHTTCLSAKKLFELKESELPAKFFSIGKVFRNETVDWSHGFEFNQSEGIVIDKDANFMHLIGYLKEFARKMGYSKFRIQPAYFPYTEPSLEGAIWNEEKKEWVEVIAAGIFRPEVVVPLLGKDYKVLAWGPGFDRLMMQANGIKDLRELYKNDIKKLREKEVVLE